MKRIANIIRKFFTKKKNKTSSELMITPTVSYEDYLKDNPTDYYKSPDKGSSGNVTGYSPHVPGPLPYCDWLNEK